MKRTLTILGAGPEAALAAAYLGKRLSKGFNIVWARGSADDNPSPVRTGPVVHAMLGSLELDEKPFLAHGGYSLGTAIAAPPRPPLFLGHGDQPSSISGIPFYQALRAVEGTGCPPAPQHYSLPAMLAETDNLRLPSSEPGVPGGLYGYGLVVDGAFWMQKLTDYAAAEGVSIIDAEEAGGDFLIDARAADGESETWKSYGGNNIAVDTAERIDPNHPPYIFCSVRPESVDIAIRTGRKAYHRAIRPAENGMPFGRLAQPWNGNRIAIGAAAALLPGILPHSFDLIIGQLRRIVELAPADKVAAQESKEFNRRVGAEIDRAFEAESLFLPGPLGVPPSEELTRKIEQFQFRGRLALDDGDVFTEDEWVAMLDYRFGPPEIVDIRTTRLPKQQLADTLRGLRNQMMSMAHNAPSHEEVIAKIRETEKV